MKFFFNKWPFRRLHKSHSSVRKGVNHPVLQMKKQISECSVQTSHYFSLRKVLLIIMLAFIAGLLLSCFQPRVGFCPGSPLPPHSAAPKLPTILLDPGHGGWDGGTHDHNGLLEKDIVLKFGFLLKVELERYGFPVQMTRTTDRELSEFAPYQGTRQRTDLLARVRMVNRYQADYFISLHVNAASDRRLSGAITFYQRKNSESKELAHSIQKAIQVVQSYNTQKILPGNFYLLNCSPVPAVLLELAFISNQREHALLQDPTFLQQMAKQIAAGIHQHVTRVSKQSFFQYLF